MYECSTVVNSGVVDIRRQLSFANAPVNKLLCEDKL